MTDEALDRPVWRIRFGRGCGRVVRLVNPHIDVVGIIFAVVHFSYRCVRSQFLRPLKRQSVSACGEVIGVVLEKYKQTVWTKYGILRGAAV